MRRVPLTWLLLGSEDLHGGGRSHSHAVAHLGGHRVVHVGLQIAVEVEIVRRVHIL